MKYVVSITFFFICFFSNAQGYGSLYFSVKYNCPNEGRGNDCKEHDYSCLIDDHENFTLLAVKSNTKDTINIKEEGVLSPDGSGWKYETLLPGEYTL